MASEKTPLLQSGNHDTPTPDVGFTPTDEKHEKISIVPFKQLFRFHDNVDVILMILGTFGSMAYGVLTPAQFLLMNTVTGDFVDFVQCLRRNCTNPVDLEDSMTTVAMWYIMFAFLNLVCAWAGLGLWGLTAERQVHKMRLAMFRNIIHQEIAWFDTHPSGELGTRLTEDLNRLADGIGSKFGRLIFSFSAFIAGYTLGFVYLWKLTLAMLAVLPVIALSGGILAKIIGGFTAKELAAYAKAGSVAEESFSSIRTVAAFGGEAEQTKKYDIHLTKSRKFGITKGLGVGIGLGIFQVTTLGNYALALWYGVSLIIDGDAEPGEVASVFYMVMLGSVMLGQAAPCSEALAAARGVAYSIFNIIDRVVQAQTTAAYCRIKSPMESAIDPLSAAGMKPDVLGDVEFRDIDFVYPSRPTVQILKNFSLKVPRGKRVALVGESGCGKSTVVKLISRFYDPQKGSVLLDGKNIKDINVSHLRRHIGVVNQEPILFSTTIAENISFGREGVTQQEIEQAAKTANAHNGPLAL